MNVSGHRIGSAEIESALVSHPFCSEAAVVGFPHPIKGEGIFAYVILKDGYEADEELVGELRNEVRRHIGAFATPDQILIAPGLPKTRSGKLCDVFSGRLPQMKLKTWEILLLLLILQL